MKINYEEISRFYRNIIHYIFNEIENVAPIRWDEQSNQPVYSDEYKFAYDYLNKAIWRLDDVLKMSDYYDEENFEYFGLEHLSDARYRIEHYLEDSNNLFINDKIVQNYTHYDDIVIDYYQPIRLDNDYFMYYQKILYRDSNISHIQFEIDELKQNVEMLQNSVDHSDYLANKSTIQSIIKELNQLLNKIEIEQIEIEKETE